MIEILFCLIVGITDGDTLTARCGTEGAYEQIKVRIIAIDAPERKQPFGTRSKQYLSDLCYKKEAQITVYYSDRWGRKVADVECAGYDVQIELVNAGMAWYWPKYSKTPQHEFLQGYQDAAMFFERGVWSIPNPIPPWEFRRR